MIILSTYLPGNTCMYFKNFTNRIMFSWRQELGHVYDNNARGTTPNSNFGDKTNQLQSSVK